MQRERETERETDIYIYIEREREERKCSVEYDSTMEKIIIKKLLSTLKIFPTWTSFALFVFLPLLRCCAVLCGAVLCSTMEHTHLLLHKYTHTTQRMDTRELRNRADIFPLAQLQTQT